VTEKKSRKAGEKTVTLRQTKSGICAQRKQKLTLRGLGFRRIGQTVVRPDNPAIRGMVLSVRHLVEVVEE
jgi:large subunit ribosomal protein L30